LVLLAYCPHWNLFLKLNRTIKHKIVEVIMSKKHGFSVLLIVCILSFLLLSGCSPGCAPPIEPDPGMSGEPLNEGQIDFYVNPPDIQAGDCAELTWNVPSRQVFGVFLNGQEVDNAGKQQVCPGSTEMFHLEVDIGDRVLHKEVMLNVFAPGQPGTPGQGQQPSQPQQPGQQGGCDGPPTFTFFDANPTFITQGQSATLDWGPITNGMNGPLVASVVLSPGGFGEVGSPGSLQVSPSTTTTYVLTATGCGGTATRSVEVQVGPPGGGGTSGPAKVTNVVAYFPGGQQTATYTGPSFATHTFIADITVDGACTVTYQWERSDGSIGQTETIVFSSAGAQQVSTTWTFGGGPGSGTVWQRVNVLTPLPMTSNKATLTVNFTS
jgi:hypothetical protein